MVAAEEVRSALSYCKPTTKSLSRFDAISMLSVNAVVVLANPSAAGRTASHDQRHLPDAVRGITVDHLHSTFG
jgi:hypothetical protein